MEGYEFLDAFGGIGESLVAEAMEVVESIPCTRSGRLSGRGIGSRGRNRAKVRRRLSMAASIALAMSLLGVTVFAGLLSSGKLVFFREGKQTEKQTGVRFVLDDSVKVVAEDIKGEVMACSSQIIRQVAEYDWISAQDPHSVEQVFSGIGEAVSYVGYSGLHWPELGEEAEEAHVSVYGKDDGEIETIAVQAEYRVTDRIRAFAEARLFTAAYQGEISVGATSHSDAFDGVDYSGKSVLSNGRDFYVVDSTEYENGWLHKIVYWQEKHVLYSFVIRYQKEDKKQVNDLASRWMEGF